MLNDSGDDVAFAVCVFVELTVALYFADALAHDLLESGCGNTTKLVLVRRIVTLVDPVAVVVDVVGGELHVEVLWVDFNNDFVGGVWPLLVGSGECFN